GGVEGGGCHDHDHHGSGEHRRQDRVLEPVRKMLRLDEKVEGALGSDGYLPHGVPSKDRGDEHRGPSIYPNLRLGVANSLTAGRFFVSAPKSAPSDRESLVESIFCAKSSIGLAGKTFPLPRGLAGRRQGIATAQSEQP